MLAGNKSGQSSGGGGAVSSSGGSPLQGGLWKFVLPDRRLPGDLDIGYSGTPGFRANVKFEPAGIKLWNDLSPQFLIGFFYENNGLSVRAPTGFGIFGDPARARASAEFFAPSEEIRIPVYLLESEGGNYKFLIGQGWMWEHAHSSALVKSASLDLYEEVDAVRTTPIFSLTTEFRRDEAAGSWLDIPSGLRFSGVDVSLYGLKTEYMWTVGVTGGLVWRF